MNDFLLGAASALLLTALFCTPLAMDRAQKYQARHKLKRAFRRYHATRRAGA